MIESGFITAVGIIWLLCRFDLKKIAGYAAAWDIAISAGMAALFIGTYAGMVTGLLAGVIVSLFLTVVKKVGGHKKLEFVRLEGERIARLRWVFYK